MPRCGACGRRLAEDQEFCAACEAARDDAANVDPGDASLSGEPTVQVARFNNAAEAGFFADELQDRLQIPVRLRVEENFDALTGYWANRIVLLVPESAGPAAAALLREVLEETEGEEDPTVAAAGHSPEIDSWSGAGGDPAESVPPQSGINWVPIVLTLAAGSAAIWGVRKLNEAPKPNAGPVPVNGREGELWNTLRLPNGGWTLNHDEIPGRRQLRIDARRGLVVIQEDANGDGVYESELRLRPVAH